MLWAIGAVLDDSIDNQIGSVRCREGCAWCIKYNGGSRFEKFLFSGMCFLAFS